MSTDGDGVSREEYQQIRDGLAQLHEAVEQLREASTPQERAEARADVQEARSDLDETARRAGVSRTVLDEAIAAAQTAKRKEELTPIFRELWQEQREADEAAAAAALAAADDKPETKPRERKPRAAASTNGADPDEPVIDTEPAQAHWSERPVSGLLK